MLKNYTSSISADKSVLFIERKLVQHNAKQILKEYGPDARLAAICFMIPINGHDIPFKLPANIAKCEEVLLASLSPRARPETIKRVSKQAERTAWKILSDWVEAQMAMIELAQVEILEVFLAYVFDNQKQRTFFEGLKEKKFKALLPGKGE